jgi:hypothetical protein
LLVELIELVLFRLDREKRIALAKGCHVVCIYHAENG